MLLYAGLPVCAGLCTGPALPSQTYPCDRVPCPSPAPGLRVGSASPLIPSLARVHGLPAARAVCGWHSPSAPLVKGGRTQGAGQGSPRQPAPVSAALQVRHWLGSGCPNAGLQTGPRHPAACPLLQHTKPHVRHGSRAQVSGLSHCCSNHCTTLPCSFAHCC